MGLFPPFQPDGLFLKLNVFERRGNLALEVLYSQNMFMFHVHCVLRFCSKERYQHVEMDYFLFFYVMLSSRISLRLSLLENMLKVSLCCGPPESLPEYNWLLELGKLRK